MRTFPQPTEQSEAKFSMGKRSSKLSVGILMCTYNGEKYLREQIDSFITQTHSDWSLFVSDDGSSDGTLAILDEYRLQLGSRLTVLSGPRKGFAQNFMSLIRNESIRCDAYAFSDQDDIWLPDKLLYSLEALESVGPSIPTLYCSRTCLIDSKGTVIGMSPLFNKQPGFKNALVQSLAGANTMLINERTRDLLALTDAEAPIVAHDWLAYLVVSGCGGKVIYDPSPTLLYRQHESNEIGANVGLVACIGRIQKMIGGRFKCWNEKNLAILSKYSSSLTPESRDLLQKFTELRGGRLWPRLKALRHAGFYRQTLAGTVSLFIAVVLRQV